ncbi:uncharacterized protein SRS1_11606 [Sporisorium reilianum f. sp. reilianum]|uniref:GAR domain-containing protein n=1 Tax=Sporisorium reilianum f. sp. reilianum TaxID=72559 RepID=A0A2N8U6I6_9BASI|nr:uncharacterized protein SRS1_11606 [Sporisorium reilianum f. sp. reilianum]
MTTNPGSSIVALESSSSLSTDGHTTIEATDSDSMSKSGYQMSDQEQLSSQDFVQLTRISRKKQDIEHHIDILQSWPTWDPFKQVSTYSADLATLERTKTTLDAIAADLHNRQTECNRLEYDVQQFNLDDMKRLRSVAKAVSKRHLSGPDTDLLELALDTVFALDKLLRLLRDRRREHDLTELRLQWENLIRSSWIDVVDLRRDIEAFERKCKALAASRSNATDTLPPGVDSLDSNGRGSTSLDASHDTSKQRIPRSASSSSRLASESLKLETSRLVLRIRRFDTEKARPAGRLLDLLIDQRQVPERLIDEQEKLEDALPQPAVIEAKSSQTLSTLDCQKSVPTSQGHSSGGSTSVAPESVDPVPAISSKGVDLASDESPLVNGLSTTKPDSPAPPRLTKQSRETPSSRSIATPVRHTSIQYRSDPSDALDVAVGNVINRMPVSVPIKNAGLASYGASKRPGMFQDLSGQYWIGEPEPRLCFCRILKSKMVMVRVGGGWQELSEFIMQHFAHLANVSDDSSLGGSTGRPACNLMWPRSASGPVISPRLRTRSSVGSLRSTELMHRGTPLQSSRIVTMPPVRTTSILTPASRPNIQNVSSIAPHRAPLESRDRSFSTPCKTSDLPSSDSGSSIIIHPSPPAT